MLATKILRSDSLIVLYYNNNKKVVFLISKSAEEEMNIKVRDEYNDHGDILQANIPDGHRLQNYKLVFGKLILNTSIKQ